ncbi:gamma carbonic anhydrase family protein [Sphingobium subterraneum]|uniref:Carbonic anhydrase/acetyltransferase-like protein (Isoleucine patch superfamily) n=1 Tax=Sphingobium subterraneum TaxID=627688 RepID=A0A841J4S7_9SPHN|nr:gamma carbonic anhydrase family protein [Sphingobium subterraneum]MBB6123538.1 carbonic anhydrase/acetyltransferase-like protein (isoleucine patch superfamily) [Sphingobium subterraneum]
MSIYEYDGKQPSFPADGTAWVAPSADVMGDVRLGSEASVWFGVVIRADNTPITIGTRSNVQDNAVLHSDPGVPLTLGEGVTVGHKAILHGCTIGDNTLIGMGATILNGAVIPENCLVGAGALVTEGKTFPPGSLIVGVPAKAIRELDEAALAGLRASAASYVAKSKQFAGSLRRVD